VQRDLREVQREIRDLLVQKEPAGPTARHAPGAKSRVRRADLVTIFVTKATMSARSLATSGELMEKIDHRRISELRKRGDIRAEQGHLVLPQGCTGDGSWVILPKRP
jgi:hypothetical protein